MKGILSIVLIFAVVGTASAQYANAVTSFHSGYTSLSSSAQAKPYDVLNIQKGFNPPGSRMAKLGKTFVVVGGALIVGGILVSSNAKSSTINNGNGTYYQDNSSEVLGIVMIIYGVGFTIPGAILWSKGAKKMRWYEQQQELTLNIRGAGLGLSYKF